MEDIRVVFVEPLFEINIGYVARTMKNFKIHDLYLVNPRTEVGKISLIYSAHAKDIILNAQIVHTIQEAIDGIGYVVGTTGKPSKKNHRVLRVAITPEDLGKNMADYEGRVAILLGREDIGLKNEELELCNIVVTIPANPLYPILNVSHAAAIIFYEIYKHNILSRKRTSFGIKRPSDEEVMLLEKYFNELLEKIQMPSHKKKIARIVFKRMIGRAFLSKRELFSLVGILRRTVEALSSTNEPVNLV